jgi:mannitol/fructose-specific phosphotransferase system IIA component (Ntr-type)
VLGELARLVADEESLSAILAANSVNHVVQIIRQFGLPTP